MLLKYVQKNTVTFIVVYIKMVYYKVIFHY